MRVKCERRAMNASSTVSFSGVLMNRELAVDWMRCTSCLAASCQPFATHEPRVAHPLAAEHEDAVHQLQRQLGEQAQPLRLGLAQQRLAPRPWDKRPGQAFKAKARSPPSPLIARDEGLALRHGQAHVMSVARQLQGQERSPSRLFFQNLLLQAERQRGVERAT